MINTCYRCEERHLGCHAECERYQDALKKHNELREEVAEKRNKYYETFSQRKNRK